MIDLLIWMSQNTELLGGAIMLIPCLPGIYVIYNMKWENWKELWNGENNAG